MSCCVTGKAQRANGFRILPRRADHQYPPTADALNPKARPGAAASDSYRIKAVVLLDDAGNVLRAFESQSKAASALGISPSQVTFAVRGDNVTKVVAPTGYNHPRNLHLQSSPASASTLFNTAAFFILNTAFSHGQQIQRLLKAFEHCIQRAVACALPVACCENPLQNCVFFLPRSAPPVNIPMCPVGEPAPSRGVAARQRLPCRHRRQIGPQSRQKVGRQCHGAYAPGRQSGCACRRRRQGTASVCVSIQGRHRPRHLALGSVCFGPQRRRHQGCYSNRIQYRNAWEILLFCRPGRVYFT